MIYTCQLALFYQKKVSISSVLGPSEIKIFLPLSPNHGAASGVTKLCQSEHIFFPEWVAVSVLRIHCFTVYCCVWCNITQLTCACRKGSKSAKVRLAGWKNQHVFKYHRRFLELSQILSFFKLKKYQSTFLIPKSAKQTHKIVSNFIETMLNPFEKNKTKTFDGYSIFETSKQNIFSFTLLFVAFTSLD